jgi:ABC-type transport system involved in multi-copper enzyme maturation permease subunit
MNTILALANVVLKEMYRRKDFYVLLFLTAVLTLTLGAVHFFNDDRIARFLKELCLLMIWISALVITITATARQIPAERESRTIFPLLAKPVSRGQVVVGKFLGCWLASGVALVLFYLFLFVISGSKEGTWPVLNYVQALWLQWMGLAVVTALVLFGSVVFTAPSSNVTITFVAVLGLMLVGGHLNIVAVQQSEPVRSLIYTVYFIIPHLEWFDIRDLIINDRPLIPWIYCWLAAIYALAYAGLFMFLAWLVFRRKALTA